MGSAVADTSPLVFLSSLERFDLLDLFDRVFLPPQVLAELAAGSGKDQVTEPRVREAVKRGKLVLREAPVPSSFVSGLGEGERAALFLAIREPGTTFLVDDKPARHAARVFNVRTMSVPFLLAEGVRRGRLSPEEFERDLDRLLALRYFIAPKVHRQALEIVRRVA